MNDFPDGNVRLLVIADPKPASTPAHFTSRAPRSCIAGASLCRLRYGDGDTAFASALGACKTATSVPPGAQSLRKLCIVARKSTYSKIGPAKNLTGGGLASVHVLRPYFDPDCRKGRLKATASRASRKPVHIPRRRCPPCRLADIN